jgi:5-methylcytosine-specific restriction endonuclease McrA
MAMAPPRPCWHPTCPNLLTNGAPCPDHPNAYEQARGSAHARGYTDEWCAYARAWLVRFPWCGQRQDGVFYSEHSHCVRRGEQVCARVVDHIRSLARGGALLDPANHQSLCIRCNTVKG